MNRNSPITLKLGDTLTDPRPLIIRSAFVPASFIGHHQSTPSGVTTPYPDFPVKDPKPVEHPQEMSTTVEVSFLPLGPENGSNLVPAHHPELMAVQP